MRKTLAMLASVLLFSGFCLADTFDSAHQIIATFSTVPGNNADLLLLGTNDSVTVMGSPVLTLKLYDGATVLGTIVAPLATSGGTTFFTNAFEAPGSPFVSPWPSTRVDFSSINSGTISGELVWTISGGSISGFSLSDFVLQDAVNCGSNCYTAGTKTGEIIGSFAGGGGNGTIILTPEPSSLLLLGTGLIGGIAGLRRRIRH